MSLRHQLKQIIIKTFCNKKRGAVAPRESFAIQAQYVNRSVFFCLRPGCRQGRAHPPRVARTETRFCPGVRREAGPNLGSTGLPRARVGARNLLATPACCTARVAFHARAIAHQCVVSAVAAGFALVTLHLGFDAGINGR